ncbi:M14 family metallopeptidase [Diaphorobacter aerolatus]|uniref:succinylglutamate desuccinylase/aspartoacylase domain-containing protein n=1 Tax=Diaphorobacter aerolatus TaxID=1288495 RepID=UPI001D01DF60|nr:succinylglutamate desuccinylase/aspartoacylase family protein [Diaphorobacter aerolatus]
MGQIKDFLASQGAAAIREGMIDVGSMSSGMAVGLPYLAIRGARPGKTLWLHGQVHGDEINGMIAALRFARRIDPAQMSGNVVVTPTGNPHALDARRKRNPYDELDLDQTYPGNPGGLISERLAHALMQEIDGVADVLINLHTMNALFDSRAYAVYKVHPQSPIPEQELLRLISLFEPNVACRMDVGGPGSCPETLRVRSTTNASRAVSRPSCWNSVAAADTRRTTSNWLTRASRASRRIWASCP